MNRVYKNLRVTKKKIEMSLINKKTFGHKQNTDSIQANAYLYEKLQSGEPFSASRIGFAEMDFFSIIDRKGTKKINPSSEMSKIFDGKPELMEKYVEELRRAYRNTDLFIAWYQFFRESKLISKYGKRDARCTDSAVLEPFYMEKPWTRALEGKKVLVISPFSKTIENQYSRIQKIYPNGFMPRFELQTIQSVWYTATTGKDERFATWHDALEYLRNQIKARDFDVALLSCGPFGVPLLSTIKEMGKQGIYVGGVLQLYFGIRGNRWDTWYHYDDLYNEYWVRPGEDNRPSGAGQYEDGCYW